MINYKEIDSGIRDNIKTLNELGFKTLFSCSSHYDHNIGFMYNKNIGSEDQHVKSEYIACQNFEDEDKRSIYFQSYVYDNIIHTFIVNTAYIIFDDLDINQTQILFEAYLNCDKHDLIKLSFSEEGRIELRICNIEIPNEELESDEEIEKFLNNKEKMHELFSDSYFEAIDAIDSFTNSVVQTNSKYTSDEYDTDNEYNAEKAISDLEERIKDTEEIIQYYEKILAAASIAGIIIFITAMIYIIFA